MSENILNFKSNTGAGGSDMPIADQVVVKWAELTEALSPYYLGDILRLYEKNVEKMQKEYGNELAKADRISCFKAAAIKVSSKVSMVRTVGVCCTESMDDD